MEGLRDWAQRRGRALPVYRTDEHGTVEVITDGAQVWVRTERQPSWHRDRVAPGAIRYPRSLQT